MCVCVCLFYHHEHAHPCRLRASATTVTTRTRWAGPPSWRGWSGVPTATWRATASWCGTGGARRCAPTRPRSWVWRRAKRRGTTSCTIAAGIPGGRGQLVHARGPPSSLVPRLSPTASNCAEAWERGCGPPLSLKPKLPGCEFASCKAPQLATQTEHLCTAMLASFPPQLFVSQPWRKKRFFLHGYETKAGVGRTGNEATAVPHVLHSCIQFHQNVIKMGRDLRPNLISRDSHVTTLAIATPPIDKASRNGGVYEGLPHRWSPYSL